MAVYDLLASGLDADWIEPECEFTSLDQTGTPIQRSVDFVSSIPTSRNPLDERSIQLYLLTECKYCAPNETIWVFMPDMSPRMRGVFDDWRPALWQDREPHEHRSDAEIARIMEGQAPSSPDKGLAPRCVRGAPLGVAGSDAPERARGKQQRRLPALSTALHQLRDCLHHLATERFRLFTKQWSQPAALVFVPVLVTNAEMRMLKPGIHERLLAMSRDDQPALDDVATIEQRVLLRCPSSLDQVDWKWHRFYLAHGGHDLSRVEKGLPAYKRERTIEAHLRNFFTTTPGYVMVVRVEEAKKLLAEVVDWAKSLEFRPTDNG